jgi:hypothetical protein
MRRRSSAVTSDDAAAVRFAWWAAFFATLTLIVILGFAKSAQALTVPVLPSATGPALAPPSDEESEDEAEASEGEADEFEECLDDEECDEGEEADHAPQECLLSSAEATVSAAASKDQIRLQIRYTTSSPTAVTVDYGLHGSKGSLYLGGDKKHFAKQGVLRLSKSLTEVQMAKVMAAKGFTVRLRVPAAPGYCQSFFDHQLDIRRATPSGLSWQQSE